MAVPNTFAAQTGPIPLSQLDANFAYYDAAYAIAAGTMTISYNLAVTGVVSGIGFSNYLAAPPAIGGTTPAAGAFTTLSASSTVSGVGFTNYLASPPAIGGTTPAQGKFTNIISTGDVYNSQPTPTALTATSTLTIAQILTNIITVTSATAVTLTLPTGTLTDAGVLSGALQNDGSFDWNIINLGSSTGAVTMAAGTGHTYVGATGVAIGTSATFRTRKTATNTFVTYRVN